MSWLFFLEASMSANDSHVIVYYCLFVRVCREDVVKCTQTERPQHTEFVCLDCFVCLFVCVLFCQNVCMGEPIC